MKRALTVLALAALAAVLFILFQQRPGEAADAHEAGLRRIEDPKDRDAGKRSNREERQARRVDEPKPAELKSVLVKGRCVDSETKRGIGGCSIEVTLRAPVQVQASDKNEAKPANTKQGVQKRRRPRYETRSERVFKSDASGRFEFRVNVGETWFSTIWIRAEGRIARRGFVRFDKEGDRDLGDIPLRLGTRIVGTVKDSNGQPVSGLRFSFRHAMGSEDRAASRSGAFGESRSYTATSRQDGSFVSDQRLPTGRYYLRVPQGQRLVGQVRPLIDSAEAIKRVEIVLEAKDPRDLITGVVVGPDGKTAESVRVVATIRTGNTVRNESVRTNRDGHFELWRRDDMPRSVAPSLRIRAEGMRAEYRSPNSVPWGSRDLRIALSARTGLEVHVVDADGKPVEAFGIVCKQRHMSNTWRDRPRTHAGGKATVFGFGDGENVLVVTPESDAYLPRLVGFRYAKWTDPLRVVLRRAREYPVVVVYPDGQPVREARVELVRLLWLKKLNQYSLVTDVRKFLHRASTNGGVGVRLCAAKTDQRGIAQLAWQASKTPLVVRVRGENVPHDEYGVILSETTKRPIRIVVPRAARIHGAVRPASLLPGLDTAVRGYRMRGGLVLVSSTDRRRRFPSGINEVIKIEADGSFERSGVPPGTWNVHVKRYAGNRRGGDWLALQPALGQLVLNPGESKRLDFDLRGQVEDASLDVRILHNGKPAVRQAVHVYVGERYADGELYDQAILNLESDTNGRIVLDRVVPASVRITLSLPYTKERWRSVVAMPWTRIRPGQKLVHSASCETRTMRIRLLDADGKPAPKRRVIFRSVDDSLNDHVETDANGHAELRCCPIVETRARTLAVGWDKFRRLPFDQRQKLVIPLGTFIPSRDEKRVVLRIPAKKKG